MKNVFDTLTNTETSSILDDNSSWNNVLSKLKPHQKQELLASINQFLANNKITPFTKTDLSCPNCSSKTFVKNGLFDSKQRYKCKGCSYSFSSTSDTSIHHIHKTDLWSDFIYLLLSSPIPLTLKELSEKLCISTKTAHVWKHKFLSSINEAEQIELNNCIEMDEVYLPFCVKGKRGYEKSSTLMKHEDDLMKGSYNTLFLCFHNRNNDFDFYPLKVQKKGHVSEETVKNVIEKFKIERDTIVITDSAKSSINYFSTRTDITHQTFKSGDKSTQTRFLHNNNINSVMSIYKDWIKRFKGYSTKYIWNYLKWFRFHRKFNDLNLDVMVSNSVLDIKANIRYLLIPKYYEKFIEIA